ncbi:TlpA family protein disulfide reductase [Celerinatantimonas sp. MCCC 1A17872]|uniref:TlpA family protein disulfide reductase n=1 Tax=Celerinatantimonas sp. MCCC 1A17872 TaxID=3177514 RepID=UPI0038CBC4F1
MLELRRYHYWMFLALLLLAGCKEQQVAAPNAPAPDLAVVNASGDAVKLSDYAHQPRIVEFWSATCGACISMMRDWQKFAQAHPGKIAFIGVNVDSDRVKLADFAKKFDLNLNLVRDQLGITKERYRIEITPTAFFIDRHGVIQSIHMGYSPHMDLGHYVAQLEN